MSRYEKFDSGFVDIAMNGNDVQQSPVAAEVQLERRPEDPFTSNGSVHVEMDSVDITDNNSKAVNSISKAAMNQQRQYDQIDVSLVEDEGASRPKEVLRNLMDFNIEHNENYRLTLSEVSQKISDDDWDPSNPPTPGCNRYYLQWRLRRAIESLPFRLITLVLILVDVVIVVYNEIKYGNSKHFNTLDLIDLVLSTYFVFELVARILALTPSVFFGRWYNVLDFAVVLITFVVAVFSAVNTSFEAIGIIVIIRFVRVTRLFRVFSERKNLEKATRQMISQNKRRYQQDGFDLDLTYVTPRVIATSFPSSGFLSTYRNPIERVAAFLDAKHPNKYVIYNLCSERTYPTKFFHDRVERFMIDDHNVPSVEEMRNFANHVKAWLNADPENVIVVHCKGGKGRTGTMICVWLVEDEIYKNAETSLQYFGDRRTDKNVSDKFQGVETASQIRYVGYYEQMKYRLGGQLPDPRPLTLKAIRIRGIKNIGLGNGNDFWFNITKGRSNQVFSAHFGFRRNCIVDYSDAEDLLEVSILNCPTLDGDIRFLFQTSSKTVPKHYENAPFFFWLHTAFVPEVERSEDEDLPASLSNVGGDVFALKMKREELDNPHKPKTWHCFGEDFRVEVYFVGGETSSTTSTTASVVSSMNANGAQPTLAV